MDESTVNANAKMAFGFRQDKRICQQTHLLTCPICPSISLSICQTWSICRICRTCPICASRTTRPNSARISVGRCSLQTTAIAPLIVVAVAKTRHVKITPVFARKKAKRNCARKTIACVVSSPSSIGVTNNALSLAVPVRRPNCATCKGNVNVPQKQTSFFAVDWALNVAQ